MPRSTRRRTRWPALTVAALACVVVAGAPAPALASSLTAAASADFARLTPHPPLVGFLHGLDETSPRDALIVPLHPSAWRGSFLSAPYGRVHALGARYTLVVSDLWGYPAAGWYGRRAPWEDWDAWSAFVRRLAREHRREEVVWEVWNEPDVPSFWTGTRAQYFEAYRRAFVAIRDELGPRAVIAGPSTSAFSWAWVVGLLEFCRQADCQVGALAWHELPIGAGITAIAGHLRTVRVGVLRNPGYGALGVRELDVTEMVGQEDTLHAAELLAYLGQLERGGVRGASHACWPDPSGDDTCEEHTLDGLLDGHQRRRATWWAMAWYARGAGTRVAARSADPALAVLASRGARGRPAEVLLGYLDPHSHALPASTGVLLDLGGLRRVRALRRVARPRIRATALEGRGGSPATPRRVAAPRVLAASPGRLVLLVPRIAMHEVLLLQLSAPPRRARRVRASPAGPAGARGWRSVLGRRASGP